MLGASCPSHFRKHLFLSAAHARVKRGEESAEDLKAICENAPGELGSSHGRRRPTAQQRSCSGTSSTRSTREGLGGEIPTLPIRAAELEAAGPRAPDRGGVRLRGRRRRLGADDAREPARRSSAGRSCRGCCATSPQRDLRRVGARHERCPRRCCSRRSACSRSSIPTAELAVARAAAAQGLPFILSTAASHTIEDVAEAVGERQPLVSAVLAQGPRAGGELRRPRAATPAMKRSW